MGRYNIIVAKGALGALMTKEDLGIIFAAERDLCAVRFWSTARLIDKKSAEKWNF